MEQLSLSAKLIFYIIIAVKGFFLLLLWWGQTQTLRGKFFKNPDGSSDDWQKEHIMYGIAVADIVLACPVGIVGIVLALCGSHWGFFILAAIAFYFVWANTMTTVTSIKFYDAKFTLAWFFVFPFGILIGLAYIVWIVIHFKTIF